MKTKHYCICLDDPALPGICSGEKKYIGTETDLRVVLARMEERDVYPETIAACNEYFSGNTKATHNIAYNDIPILKPVQVICSSELKIGRKEWDHFNAWEWPNPVRFDSAVISQIVVKKGRKYLRCLKAWMENFAHKSVSGEWYPLDNRFWGHESLMSTEYKPDGSFVVNNLLYVVESEHQSLDELDDLILDEEQIDFKHLCDEVFGDG